MLCDNLENQGGYGVEEATNVAETRAHLARRAFQLILLDVLLPDGDGYTLCLRTLRREGMDTPPQFNSLLEPGPTEARA